MAKERIVNTRFWADSYISNLDPTEKLLFLYLITNQYTEISGVYELPLKYMSLDTGIEKEMVEKILKRFEGDLKIKYVDGWIYVLNFAKYQKDNPKVRIGIKNAMSRVPKQIKDRLLIDYDSLSHSNSNLNPNLNLNSNPNLNPKEACPDPQEVVKKLWISTLGITPGIPEAEETIKLIEKFGEATIKKSMREMALRHIKSFRYFLDNLDEKGNLKPYEDKNGRKVNQAGTTVFKRAAKGEHDPEKWKRIIEEAYT